MKRSLVLRRLVIALVGLALAMPAALPGAAAAPADGLPAALAFICATPAPADAGGNEGGQNRSDHPSCQSCAGPCHGMALAAGASVTLAIPVWTMVFAHPDEGTDVGQPELCGYASRAPPGA